MPQKPWHWATLEHSDDVALMGEERRHDLERQRRRHEQRIAVERGQDQIAKPARDRMPDRDLAVVLDPRKLVPSRCAAIDPIRLVKSLPHKCHLLSCEYFRDLQ